MKNKVKLLKSLMGVHDGQLHPVPFVEGEEYEIGPDLLQTLVNDGSVELVEDAKVNALIDTTDDAEVEDDAEVKSEGDAPANKMKKAAPENKKK